MTNREAAEIIERVANRRLAVYVGGVARELEPDDIDCALRLAVSALKDIGDCRNELCLQCGKYHKEYLGACDGCRWKKS